MLGSRILDPEQVEAAGVTEIAGMGLLDMQTVFRGQKVQTQTGGVFQQIPGLLSCLNGMTYTGYEIHMGRSKEAAAPVVGNGSVYGSYIHGIFDAPGVADEIRKALCRQRGISVQTLESDDPAAYKQRQYDTLAQAVREGLDMELVYRILNRE